MDEDLDMGFDDFSLGLTFGDMSAPQSNVATNNTNVPFLTPTVPSSNTHSAVDLDDIAGSTAIDSTSKPRVKEPLPKRVAAPVDRVTVVASPEDFITSVRIVTIEYNPRLILASSQRTLTRRNRQSSLRRSCLASTFSPTTLKAALLYAVRLVELMTPSSCNA